MYKCIHLTNLTKADEFISKILPLLEHIYYSWREKEKLRTEAGFLYSHNVAMGSKFQVSEVCVVCSFSWFPSNFCLVQIVQRTRKYGEAEMSDQIWNISDRNKDKKLKCLINRQTILTFLKLNQKPKLLETIFQLIWLIKYYIGMRD